MERDNIIRLKNNRSGLRFAGTGSLLISLAMFAQAWSFWSGPGGPTPVVLFIVPLAAIFLGLSVFAFAKAYSDPVAYRLDPDGLSGYNLRKPLKWSDIRSIGQYALPDGRTQVAVQLKDPQAYFADIGFLRRPRHSGLMRPYHLALPSRALSLSEHQFERLLTDYCKKYT